MLAPNAGSFGGIPSVGMRSFRIVVHGTVMSAGNAKTGGNGTAHIVIVARTELLCRVSIAIDRGKDRGYMKVRDKFGKEEDDSKKIKFIDNPNEIKMSAVILKLAEPYLRVFAGNEARVRTIISLTTTVWNMGFLSEEEQDDFIEKLVDKIFPQEYDAQGVAEMLSMLYDLKERKENLFPNIKVVILGHDLRMDNNNIHLDISSAPSKKKD
ncbi:MAG: hypothetical protein HQK67_05025 [Desulfamplus sp.]|nr:hypothetical protein [Desulfamplus sp.]